MIEDNIEMINIVFILIDLILRELIFNMNNANKTQNELPIEVNKFIIKFFKSNISKDSIPLPFAIAWMYIPEARWPKKSPAGEN